MKNRPNLKSEHLPMPHHVAGEAHQGPDHPEKDLVHANPSTPSLERDRKLKRHEEHHPN